MSNKNFDRALSNFTFEAASGGAIRHLLDQGYTPKEIHRKLSFPTPMGRIKEEHCRYLLSKGILLDQEPTALWGTQRYDYQSEKDSLGRPSFRRVPVEGEAALSEDYVSCEFARGGFLHPVCRRQLTDSQLEYLEGIAWPVELVYHVMNEQMREITEALCRDEKYTCVIYEYGKKNDGM